MIWSRTAAAVALAAVCFAVPPADAQTRRPAPAAQPAAPAFPPLPPAGDVMAERAYLLAVEQLLIAGAFPDAGARLRAFTPTTEYGQVMHRFLSGVVARGQGRREEAVEAFRTLLADRPDLARVRGELAATLMEMGDDDAARHHLELLRPSVAGQDGEDRVRGALAALDARRPWSANFTFGIAPSTNINSGTNSRIVMIGGLPFQVSDAGRAQSGIGAVYGTDLGYRLNLAPGLDIVAAGSVLVRDFQNIPFDQTFVAGQIGPRWSWGNGNIGVAATHATDFRGGITSNIKNGVRAFARFEITPQWDIQPDVEFYGRRFPLATLFSVNGWQVGFSSTYALSSSAFVRGFYSYSEEGASVAFNSMRTFRFGGGFYTELPWAVTLYAEGAYRRVNYNGVHPLFGSTRNDNRYEALVRLTKRDWVFWGFAPQLEYTYFRIDSNQAINNLDNHGVALTVTRRF